MLPVPGVRARCGIGYHHVPRTEHQRKAAAGRGHEAGRDQTVRERRDQHQNRNARPERAPCRRVHAQNHARSPLAAAAH